MPLQKDLTLDFFFYFYNKSKTEKYLFLDFILALTSTASFKAKCLNTSEKLPPSHSQAFLKLGLSDGLNYTFFSTY